MDPVRFTKELAELIRRLELCAQAGGHNRIYLSAQEAMVLSQGIQILQNAAATDKAWHGRE